MSIMLSSIPFITDDVRSSVATLQDMVYEINSLLKNGEIIKGEFSAWSQKRTLLDETIKSFNCQQISKVKRNSSLTDTQQLLPMYLDMNSCIQAMLKTSNGIMNFNTFITYRKRVIGFSDFFRSQYNLADKYAVFRSCFLSFAHCVFENTRSSVNGKYVYGIPGPGGANPYPYSSYNPLISNKIEQSSVASIAGVKRYLTSIFVAVCGDDIAPITGKIARCFVAGICAKKSVDTLIDDVFLGYMYEKQSIHWNEYKVDTSLGVSRHVAWCTFRGRDKECILLDQPCHASVDCAFYRENTNKRTPYLK